MTARKPSRKPSDPIEVPPHRQAGDHRGHRPPRPHPPRLAAPAEAPADAPRTRRPRRPRRSARAARRTAGRGHRRPAPSPARRRQRTCRPPPPWTTRTGAGCSPVSTTTRTGCWARTRSRAACSSGRCARSRARSRCWPRDCGPSCRRRRRFLLGRAAAARRAGRVPPPGRATTTTRSRWTTRTASCPRIGELDLHLIGEGRHEELWKALGSQPMEHQGVAGTRFTVWAPNARGVRVTGDFNYWDGTGLPDALARLHRHVGAVPPGCRRGRRLQVRHLPARRSHTAARRPDGPAHGGPARHRLGGHGLAPRVAGRRLDGAPGRPAGRTRPRSPSTRSTSPPGGRGSPTASSPPSSRRT